jgi:hypothetical protein
MILSCYSCPRRLCFAGADRVGTAVAFGWKLVLRRSGHRFYCTGCSPAAITDVLCAPVTPPEHRASRREAA